MRLGPRSAGLAAARWYAQRTHRRARMTDRTTETPTDVPETATTAPAAAPTNAVPDAAFDPARRATELAILDALRAVVDPEIGMNVVELALIKQILLGPD